MNLSLFSVHVLETCLRSDHIFLKDYVGLWFIFTIISQTSLVLAFICLRDFCSSFVIHLPFVGCLHATFYMLSHVNNMYVPLRSSTSKRLPLYSYKNDLLQILISSFNFLLNVDFHISYKRVRGTWVAQSVKFPTSVMISQFVGPNPASGSVLTAQSLEPFSNSMSPSLSAPPPLMLSPPKKLNTF